MEKHKQQKDIEMDRSSIVRGLVHLIPAAAVISAIFLAGIQAEPLKKQQETEISEIVPSRELEGLFSAIYMESDDAEEDISVKNDKSKKSRVIKRGAKRTVSSAAGRSGGYAGGMGSRQTPVAAIPSNGYTDGVYQGTGTGFGGGITVRVAVTGGRISSIEILDASGETASYLASARGVIDRVIAGQTPNVDAVSGATYSSNGIIQAIQNALAKAASDGNVPGTALTPTPTVTPVPEKPPVSEMKPDTVSYADGVYTGTADGFQSKITVNITIKNGKICDLAAEHGDTPAFFNKAWEILKPSILSRQTTNGVDTVTGATFSSNGILGAVSEALSEAEGIMRPTDIPEPTELPEPTEEPEPSDTPEPTEAPEPSDTPEPTEAPEPTELPEPTEAPEPTELPEPTNTPEPPDTPIPTEIPAQTYRDGTYTGQGNGMYGTVSVTISISGGKLVSANVSGYEDDDDYFWSAWDSIRPQIMGMQSAEGADTVSGATFSSNGIIGAFSNALNQAKGA